MRDPMIVAFEIKSPFWRHKPWPKKHQHSGDRGWRWKHSMTGVERNGRDSFWEQGYRNTLVTIWHVDPEKDGSDDSCGWAYPKLTKQQKEVLRSTAWWEARSPHFLRDANEHWTRTLEEAELLYRGMVLLVNRVLKLRLSWDQICQHASEAIHIHTGGHPGDEFCFKIGYHTNSKTDSPEQRQDHFHGILCGVARSLLDMKRPWWKHPRWHFWHWKIQWHWLQDFKRWAFSRCCKCGKRFKWGYSPVTDSWNSTGPLWFRSQKNVYHSNCDRPTDSCLAEAK